MYETILFHIRQLYEDIQIGAYGDAEKRLEYLVELLTTIQHGE